MPALLPPGLERPCLRGAQQRHLQPLQPTGHTMEHCQLRQRSWASIAKGAPGQAQATTTPPPGHQQPAQRRAPSPAPAPVSAPFEDLFAARLAEQAARHQEQMEAQAAHFQSVLDAQAARQETLLAQQADRFEDGMKRLVAMFAAAMEQRHAVAEDCDQQQLQPQQLQPQQLQHHHQRASPEITTSQTERLASAEALSDASSPRHRADAVVIQRAAQSSESQRSQSRSPSRVPPSAPLNAPIERGSPSLVTLQEVIAEMLRHINAAGLSELSNKCNSISDSFQQQPQQLQRAPVTTNLTNTRSNGQ